MKKFTVVFESGWGKFYITKLSRNRLKNRTMSLFLSYPNITDFCHSPDVDTYKVRPIPHPVRRLAKNPYPGLKFEICKIFEKRIFLKGPKCCSCFHMDPSIRKDIASSKVFQSTTTKSMFVTKRYSDFFQQNSCFVYLPQVGIPSHVLLSPAQLEGQEELLEKKVKR